MDQATHGWRHALPATCLAFALMILPLHAEEPLSVIDWLDAQNAAPQPPATPARPDEPPVATTAVAPDVTVIPLTSGGARLIGLVPASVTGLPADLWRNSGIATLLPLIATLPDPTLPAAQALLYTLLLAEAEAPGNNSRDGDHLALARVSALMRLGALDPAQSLLEQAGVETSPAHFDLWMEISLLNGTEERACALLSRAPHLTRSYGTQIFCDVRSGRWENAALTLGSAKALDLLPEIQLELMTRFLYIETSDELAPLTPPRDMDPLSFRLFESIGEAVPTGKLPRAYAVADLRDLAGWKAQLEAAERLTRTGALPDNRLLGLYSARKPAASGGVWDRVAAIQRFETALDTGSQEAVQKTLPSAWDAMRSAGLEVPFASLFAERVAGQTLGGRAAEIARKLLLLSPGYEAAAAAIDDDSLARHIARGEAGTARPADPLAGSIYDAFANRPPRAALLEAAKNGKLGEAVLGTLSLLQDGADGDPTALGDALATLRALGLEDTARRAALQVLLLER